MAESAADLASTVQHALEMIGGIGWIARQDAERANAALLARCQEAERRAELAEAEAEAERCPIPPEGWEPAKAEWHQFHLDQTASQRARAEAAEADAEVRKRLYEASVADRVNLKARVAKLEQARLLAVSEINWCIGSVSAFGEGIYDGLHHRLHAALAALQSGGSDPR